ncbi:protein FAR1-RELATED SEQUENCE 5-like [Arachis hypogaea]|uniref:protein FAR1-RELATED SEQUENCE 5-like n=1 Tax=Arachis hypogaea TaxID=3818 RepID=UPI003B226736
MNEQYQEDDDFNQQEELVSDQDMMDEQNEFEQDFGDEFTEGAYFSESNQSEDILEAAYAVDSMQNITTLKFSENFAEEIGKYHFSTLQLAFDFYLKYSKSKGFSARKSKTFKNSIGKIYKQKFVCHRQGFREEKYYTMEKRKKEPRLETRTGCEARMDVKFVPETGRWHIFYFSDKHNHDLLDTQFSAMLHAHRKMSEEDIMQMVNMLKSGISTSQIFGLLASQAGGYEFVGYGPRDIQLDYRLFGDVIAFDATYKKNEYNCPLVIFSGVNHHNQTIIFATALVVDETTDTYIWLLRQLMFAMNGKTPTSIITNGAMAIRNAVRDVFPEVRHRLCAWHLIRNATSNVGNPSFTSKFRKIMLGDYEIPVFKRKWVQLIEEFGLEDKPWVINMYEEKHMWATAYIREKFFAGFRTTSRCEGLHSVVASWINAGAKHRE